MPNETDDVSRALRKWFFGPPHAHGEVLDDRTVTFLELFYDLVFVVLIAQIAHTLASDVTWAGARDFAIVFALIWIAWINGSFYHELHGRNDGRTRNYTFAQMALLALLAVYAGHAAADQSDGRSFAIVYAILLTLIALQWFSLRKYDTPDMAALTTRFVVGMGLTITIVVVSAFVADQDARLVLWAVAIGLTVLGTVLQIFRNDPELEEAFRVTESIAERFGLFTIIVLGEVVVGVAGGLAESDRDGRTIATGIAALVIGFGFWWNYFDFVGRRQPRSTALNRGMWNFAHLPMWLAIAGAGAGMVSLVEHAGDSRTPANTAWLIAGSTALMAAALALITVTMKPHAGRRFVPFSLAAAAAISLLLGALRPAPLVLALALSATLAVVWLEAFVRHARVGSPLGDR